MALERLLTSADLAEMMPGSSENSWAQRRSKGTGPAYIKTGNRVYYRESDVLDWLDSCHRRTDDCA